MAVAPQHENAVQLAFEGWLEDDYRAAAGRLPERKAEFTTSSGRRPAAASFFPASCRRKPMR